jgi:hypothetical protein
LRIRNPAGVIFYQANQGLLVAELVLEFAFGTASVGVEMLGALLLLVEVPELELYWSFAPPALFRLQPASRRAAAAMNKNFFIR